MTEFMNVMVKHAGRTHCIALDVLGLIPTFRESIYQVTGVPPDRMKIMVKGGILKDDADISKLGIKPGQAITVIGTAGPLPQAPSKPVIFLEDMDESAVALATRTPPGLINLGQTCYLNSSLQVLRAMPQLRLVLSESPTAAASPEGRLTASIKHLFSGMSQTTEAMPPFVLLSSLRNVAPQFAEQDSRGGFSQQDADEAWTQILSVLRGSLHSNGRSRSFVDDYLSVELTTTLQCAEASEEAPTITIERALKLECNITISTNFMVSGILDSLDQQIEKTSPNLGRIATYQRQSRLSRLPAYLVVHMVRFYWRRDVQKKAKIMRKVKYPLQLDMSDLVTDGVRVQIQPINSAVKKILKSRDERATENKRTKARSPSEDKTEDELRSEEKMSIEALIDKASPADVGDNPSGMYELCAMVTHKGPSADSGHYIGWTRKEDSIAASGEEEWYKFDDDKVSVVTADKILSMDGGGEDSVAYILLYRAAMI